MEKLDAKPTVDQLRKAIDNVASVKAPGKDYIPLEVITCAKGVLVKYLYQILCFYW